MIRALFRTPSGRKLGVFAEAAVFGTHLRRAIAEFALRHYHRSVLRRDWKWRPRGEPHFFDHRAGLFSLYDRTAGQAVYAMSRGFFSAEAIREGDRVLDIGCGDGTYTKVFLAPKAGHVDAIDIEPSAIETAQRFNAAPNIAYSTGDATRDPMAVGAYDVVVFDGALGHFTSAGGEAVLAKVAASLKADGLFCGSESLGMEGDDHLQRFTDEGALRSVLGVHFAFVRTKVISYSVGGFVRQEAYWRCAAAPDRLRSLDWR